MAAVAMGSAAPPESTNDRLLRIICSKAGIALSELSQENKHALISDDDTRDLWQQLRHRIYGSDPSNHETRTTGRSAAAPHPQSAEFERVAGVESLHDQLSLTPDRIAQTEAELENLNRKTQSLVDTLRSHNTRLSAIRDGSSNNAPGGGGARTALSSKARDLKARKQELTEECEQLAAHADSRLDRYLAASGENARHADRQGSANGVSVEISASTQALRETLDGLLVPHDRILEKLDALCTELQYDDSEQKAVLNDARRLSNEIIFAIVAHQRMVLDIVFIQACNSYQEKTRRGMSAQARAANDEREAIVADLRSLWEEVVPVAHMAVEKQLVGPIIKSKSNESDRREERYALIASYTSAMLGYMNERLEEFAERIRTLVAHHKALAKTFEVFQARTANKPSVISQGAQNQQQQQQQQQQQGGPQLAPKTRSKQLRRGLIPSSSTPLDDLLSAMEALGVSLPPPSTGGAEGGGQHHDTIALAHHVDKHIQRRAAKTHVLATDMQVLFETTAKTNMTDALEATRMLAGSLVAECNGGLLPEPTLPESQDDDDGSTAESRDSTRRDPPAEGEVAGRSAFFADAELQKITADETRSVRRVADEFVVLLRDTKANDDSSGNGGARGVVPYDFVAKAYQQALAAASAQSRDGMRSAAGGGSREQQQQRQLRDPKIHEIIDNWGSRGGVGLGN
ncbi:uncharacterized protein B0I36DRAFT_358539 [Microdochium trichocladiopsis]|uniref:Uncharacterized protein n=1 Tax=Microdochium trichocladiopsis TaxID=1682393 RepID=A0A9P8YLU2_9PEZI|nr:uncharacterized protein B0I36DRAFT_358539 [Microdochium trichocladiopsis]KAH7041365.1 hypothetical protein B0I36DRAFT_358539 [Microdochium trichocladiopsis]